MVTFVEGEEYMKITIASVKFNTGLEDSLFRMNQ
jgi:outer membrane lipoprotein-sorting protein